MFRLTCVIFGAGGTTWRSRAKAFNAAAAMRGCCGRHAAVMAVRVAMPPPARGDAATRGIAERRAGKAQRCIKRAAMIQWARACARAGLLGVRHVGSGTEHGRRASSDGRERGTRSRGANMRAEFAI